MPVQSRHLPPLISDPSAPTVAHLQTTLNLTELLTALSRRWGKCFVRLRPDLPLAGSPERTAWRSVVETAGGERFVLEKIPSRVYSRKRRIACYLERLSGCGIQQVVPYLQDLSGEFISLIGHGLWQLCPFVEGVALQRPAYTLEGWRGDACAAFLIELGIVSRTRGGVFQPSPPFSIVRYCDDLFSSMENGQPGVARRFRPILSHLASSFFAEHPHLPVGFCHGDIHPLNIIWGKQSIRAVIDWEFCGTKPQAYDLANLLGCLGMEDPQSLAGPFVRRLVRRIKQAEIFADISWRTLPDLMLAIRFAWLGEWLRKNDRPMIQLEADYMDLLLTPSFGHWWRAVLKTSAR